MAKFIEFTNTKGNRISINQDQVAYFIGRASNSGQTYVYFSYTSGNEKAMVPHVILVNHSYDEVKRMLS